METLTDAKTTVGNSGVVDWEWDFDHTDAGMAEALYRSDHESITPEFLREYIVNNGGLVSNYDLN